MGDQTIVIVASIYVLPERIAEAKEAALAFEQATAQEEGCSSFHFYQHLATPEWFRVTEEWQSESTLQSHMASDHMKQFADAIPDLIAKPMEVRKYYVNRVEDM